MKVLLEFCSTGDNFASVNLLMESLVVYCLAWKGEHILNEVYETATNKENKISDNIHAKQYE